MSNTSNVVVPESVTVTYRVRETGAKHTSKVSQIPVAAWESAMKEHVRLQMGEVYRAKGVLANEYSYSTLFASNSKVAAVVAEKDKQLSKAAIEHAALVQALIDKGMKPADIEKLLRS